MCVREQINRDGTKFVCYSLSFPGVDLPMFERYSTVSVCLPHLHLVWPASAASPLTNPSSSWPLYVYSFSL